jgi:hypothetical protein
LNIAYKKKVPKAARQSDMQEVDVPIQHDNIDECEQEYSSDVAMALAAKMK